MEFCLLVFETMSSYMALVGLELTLKTRVFSNPFVFASPVLGVEGCATYYALLKRSKTYYFKEKLM